jgi:hypothetical protein
MRTKNINPKQRLFENIRPYVAKALYESLWEKKQAEQEENSEKTNKKDKSSVKIDDLVKKLMKNKEFKKKAMQYLNDEDAYDGWTEELGDQKYTSLSNLSDGSKRRIVTQRLKDKKIDWAPLAYELWPNMTEDAARSWFSKKVAGKKAEFTDEEVSALYRLLNNTVR